MLLKQEKRTFWWLVSFNLNFPEVYDTEIYFIIAQTFHLLRNSPNALFFDPISCTAAKIINVKTTVRRKKKTQKQAKTTKKDRNHYSLYIFKKHTKSRGRQYLHSDISRSHYRYLRILFNRENTVECDLNAAVFANLLKTRGFIDYLLFKTCLWESLGGKVLIHNRIFPVTVIMFSFCDSCWVSINQKNDKCPLHPPH